MVNSLDIGKNNFHTDMKRFSYVLDEGETEVPPGVKNAFDEARKIRLFVFWMPG